MPTPMAEGPQSRSCEGLLDKGGKILENVLLNNLLGSVYMNMAIL